MIFTLFVTGFCANAFKRQPLGFTSAEFQKDRDTYP